MHQNSFGTITWLRLQRIQRLVSVQCVYLLFFFLAFFPAWKHIQSILITVKCFCCRYLYLVTWAFARCEYIYNQCFVDWLFSFVGFENCPFSSKSFRRFSIFKNNNEYSVTDTHRVILCILCVSIILQVQPLNVFMPLI